MPSYKVLILSFSYSKHVTVPATASMKFLAFSFMLLHFISLEIDNVNFSESLCSGSTIFLPSHLAYSLKTSSFKNNSLFPSVYSHCFVAHERFFALLQINVKTLGSRVSSFIMSRDWKTKETVWAIFRNTYIREM